MPTAPTLNRPPKLPDTDPNKSSSFAAPPAPRQTPQGGNSAPLMQAAISRSSANNPLVTGSGGASATADTSKAPAPPKPAPVQYGNIGNQKTAQGPPSTPNYAPTGYTGSKATAAPQPNGAPTIQAPGAPPGVPDTSYTIPLLPQDEATIQGAQQTYSDTAAAANLGMGQAAFAYGDPTQMARFGVGTVNPNSALALAALKAQQQSEASTNLRGRDDTEFSSLALEDQNRIASAQQRADLLGNTRYQAALARFNTALEAAMTKRTTDISAAQADERAAALKNLPTANTATGGFASTTATGSRSIATKGGKGPTAPKGQKVTKGTVTVPKVGKSSKTSGKGSTSVKKPGSIKAGKVGKVSGRTK